MAPHDLAACGLPEAWAGQSAWTVLDTDFQSGQHFLAIWQAWQNDPQQARMLHYVGITDAIPDFAATPMLAQLVDGLGPGFHRILLDDARVSLTLCIGSVAPLLAEQVFQADTLIAREPADKWEVQALARRCKRGSRFYMPTTSGVDVCSQLQAAGFQIAASAPDTTTLLTGVFDPRWETPKQRAPSHFVQPTPARCAVVGAGVSGASIAQALARRGWQVTVFDQAPQPAAGASGLPVGLAVPHVSADDSPRSRLSRSGTRLLHLHASRILVRGQDWDPSGVTEHRADGSKLWHAQACWIKPAQLVRAWLKEPGIRFEGSCAVTTLRRHGGLWQLGNAQGQNLGEYETVVVASAIGSADLLGNLFADDSVGTDLQDKLAALQAVHGTLSCGRYPPGLHPVLPTTPVNGNGSFIPQVPDAQGTGWFAGSTFETDAVCAADGPAQHRANMERLRQLFSSEEVTDPVDWLESGPATLWSGTRCVTHDRLPLVGPVDTVSGPGLWLCVGMGSRGLSFSALCAELLVARLGGEPLPVEFSLSRSLDANRQRRRSQTPAKS